MWIDPWLAFFFALETCALFIELVKAFATVRREALFAILRRFGLPDPFNWRSEGFILGPDLVLVHHADCNGDHNPAGSQACFPHSYTRCYNG
jgi:hypothetical protein